MDDRLRDVTLDLGYRLETWDTNRCQGGKCTLRYRFTAPDGTVLFEGEDFHCSPMHAVDSDEALRSLLSFLTLRPGDTDADYFTDYTPEQLAFAERDAEQLGLYAHDDGTDYTPLAFEDTAE